jgi:hypothetical protein
MKPGKLVLAIVLLGVTFLPGCGQSGTQLTSADLGAFDSATSEMKQRWSSAQAAAATNDYVGSILTLRSMLSPSLSKEQIQAVQKALSSVDSKLMKAVERGDPVAQKALETLNASGTERR